MAPTRHTLAALGAGAVLLVSACGANSAEPEASSTSGSAGASGTPSAPVVTPVVGSVMFAPPGVGAGSCARSGGSSSGRVGTMANSSGPSSLASVISLPSFEQPASASAQMVSKAARMISRPVPFPAF